MVVLVTQEQDQATSQNPAMICRNLHFITFYTPSFPQQLSNLEKTCQLSSAIARATARRLYFLL